MGVGHGTHGSGGSCVGRGLAWVWRVDTGVANMAGHHRCGGSTQVQRVWRVNSVAGVVGQHRSCGLKG
jgi:hypothetical protein